MQFVHSILLHLLLIEPRRGETRRDRTCFSGIFDAVVSMAATPCISSSSSLNGQRVEKAGPYERPLVQGFFFCSSLALASQDLLLWARLICLLGLAYSASPYLFKASKYRRFPSLCCHLHPNDVRRPFRDKLVWTSLIYAVPAVYAIAAHQYGIAVLQTLTTIGSTLFHWTRETMVRDPPQLLRLPHTFRSFMRCRLPALSS